MDVELQATCSALGYLEDSQYHKEPDCYETVRDLILYLKRDDDVCRIRRQLGNAQIVENDLLQLVKYYSDDGRLFDVVLRLLVNLTLPAIHCFKYQVPKDKGVRRCYLEVEGHLESYKSAFADDAFFTVLTQQLGDLLKNEDRLDDDTKTVERILHLLRNILHIPTNSQYEQRTDDDANLHDQILWNMHISKLEDIVLYLSGSANEMDFSVLVLEIIHLMLKEQTAEQLASSGRIKSLVTRIKDEKELKEMREKEAVVKTCGSKLRNSRHSKFGGTFTMKNMKSISENNMICHRQSNKNQMNFDKNKKTTKIGRNRAPLQDDQDTRRSTLSIRLCLRNFCVQFLDNCYNTLMHNVHRSLLSVKEDDSVGYFLWCLQFFMEFNRLSSQPDVYRSDIISETMSLQTLHNVQVNMMRYHESAKTDKNDAKIWSKRLHLGLKAYAEILKTLNMLERCPDPTIKEASKVVKSNVFYTCEYRDIFIILLKNFDPHLQSRTFLKDLINTTHIYTKMLDNYAKQKGTLVVEKKKKKKNKNKKKKEKKDNGQEEGGVVDSLTETQLDDLWAELAPNLSELLQEEDEAEGEEKDAADDAEDQGAKIEIDFSSEIDEDRQKLMALHQIQGYLRSKSAKNSLSSMKSAGKLWPDDCKFGGTDISEEDFFMLFRDICFTTLPPLEQQCKETSEPKEDGVEEWEDEEEEVYEEVSEQNFNFKDFIYRFANPRILKSYTNLLETFESNSYETNHSCVKLLHRIAFDCNLSSMMMQIRLFIIMQKALNPRLAKSSQYAELAQFSKFIVNKFVKIAANNDKVFMELFFWKHQRDATDIELGYGYSEEQRTQKSVWSEDQEEELLNIVEDYRLVENPEIDMGDFVLERITDQRKTRRQVIKKLVQSGYMEKAVKAPKSFWTEDQNNELEMLANKYKEIEKPECDMAEYIGYKFAQHNKSRKQVIRQLLAKQLLESSSLLRNQRSQIKKTMSSQEVEQIQFLFEEYSETNDVLGHILSRLSVKRSKTSIIDKLLELRLISDKSQVLKKRSRKRAPRIEGEVDNSEEGKNVEDGDKHNAEDEYDHLPPLDIFNENQYSTGSDSSSSDSDNDEQSKLTKGSQEYKNAKEAVSCVLHEGQKQAVEWIRNVLKRTLEDIEMEPDAEDIHPSPLVPTNMVHNKAMQDSSFKTMLRRLLIVDPVNQEMFWRIKILSKESLRNRLQIIREELGEDCLSDANEDDIFADVSRINETLLSEEEQDSDEDRLVINMDAMSPINRKYVESSEDETEFDRVIPEKIKNFSRRPISPIMSVFSQHAMDRSSDEQVQPSSNDDNEEEQLQQSLGWNKSHDGESVLPTNQQRMDAEEEKDGSHDGAKSELKTTQAMKETMIDSSGDGETCLSGGHLDEDERMDKGGDAAPEQTARKKSRKRTRKVMIESDSD